MKKIVKNQNKILEERNIKNIQIKNNKQIFKMI